LLLPLSGFTFSEGRVAAEPGRTLRVSFEWGGSMDKILAAEASIEYFFLSLDYDLYYNRPDFREPG
jgi:hypothetical protein